MTFLKVLMVILITVIIPLIFGILILRKELSTNGSYLSIDIFARTYAVGFFAAMSVFEIITVSMTFLHQPFHLLFNIFCVFLAVIIVAGIFLRPKVKKRGKIEKAKLSTYEKVFLIIFIALFSFSLLRAAFMTDGLSGGDDAVYLVRSNGMLFYDSLNSDFDIGPSNTVQAKYGLTSIDAFLAFLSAASGLSVASVAHTYFLTVMTFLAYCVFYLVACFLFKEREGRIVFMGFLAVIIAFGKYGYDITDRLGAMWHGKSIMMVIVLPFLFSFLPVVLPEKFSRRNALIIFLCTMTACGMTTMGAFMSIMVVGLMCFLFYIKTKGTQCILYFLTGMLPGAIQTVAYIFLR